MDLETRGPVIGKGAAFLAPRIPRVGKWTLQLVSIAPAFAAGDPVDRSRGRRLVELPRAGVTYVEDGSLAALLGASDGLGNAPAQSLASCAETAEEFGVQCSAPERRE